jgi:hypothetical protein
MIWATRRVVARTLSFLGPLAQMKQKQVRNDRSRQPAPMQEMMKGRAARRKRGARRRLRDGDG